MKTLEVEKILSFVLGYEPRRIEPCEVYFHFINDEEIGIEWRGIRRDFMVYDGVVYDSENDTSLFDIIDLNQFEDFRRKNTCPDCDGEGFVEVQAVCHKPASDCCGGCTEMVDCECENIMYSI